MFLCDNLWKIWTFSILQPWNRFSGKRKPFSKNWSTVFWFKAQRLKTHHLHTKLPYQKSILRQIEWRLQNEPITKNGFLPVTDLFISKFCFSLRTSYKELICCTNNPNIHICNFCKRWSFIWRCFFPVSILKGTLIQIWKSADIFVFTWK